MMFDLNSHHLNGFYDKARKAYFECINNPDNAYLQSELPIPIHDVVLRNTSVKAVFNETIAKISAWEVVINLWGPATVIGRYTYIEDGEENSLDDVLIFY